MIIKILGLIDFLCGFSIVFNDSVPSNIIRMLALILLGKGGLFASTGDIASYLDVLCAFYMLAMTLGFLNPAFSALAAIFLMQKAVLTLLT